MSASAAECLSIKMHHTHCRLFRAGFHRWQRCASTLKDSFCFGAPFARHDEERSDRSALAAAFVVYGCSAAAGQQRSLLCLHPGSRKGAHCCPSSDCSSPVEQTPLFAHYSSSLPSSRSFAHKCISTIQRGCAAPRLASTDGAACGSVFSLPYLMHRFCMFDQRRYVRPNRGRNDYQRVGGKKRGRGIEALPETLDLLIEAQDAEATTALTPVCVKAIEESRARGTDFLGRFYPSTRPGVPMTEAMAVPTVADVNAPLSIHPPWTSNCRRRGSTPTDCGTHSHDSGLENDTWSEPDIYEARPTQSTGKLGSVALHVGDVSRLRVDATVFGTTPCLKVVGGGRGFVGCSSLIAGAGPMLPLFVTQQRNFLIKADIETPGEDSFATASASAGVAIAALREGVARLVTQSPQGLLKDSFNGGISPEDVSKLPPAELSAVAASAARQCVASCQWEGAHAEEEKGPAIVSPMSFLRPGSVMLSPGFSLPSCFLVHVVEPNAVYSSEHFFGALSRLEELGAAQRQNGKGKAPSWNEQKNDWQAIHDETEKNLYRRCWERMRLLEDCYLKALNAAAGLGVRSVAIPCLGTGTGGFPKYIAARCAAKAVGWWMKGQTMRERMHERDEGLGPDANPHSTLERVVFCTTSDQEWKALRHFIPEFFD